jgi:hypothetical protein
MTNKEPKPSDVNNDLIIYRLDEIKGELVEITGFYALLKFVLENASKATENDREERKELSIAVNRMATATEKSAKEAEQRNGHLAEISIQNKVAILEAINNRI